MRVSESGVPFPFLDPGRLADAELELVLVGCRPADPTRGYDPTYRFRMVHAGCALVLGHIELRIGDPRNPNIRLGGNVAYRVEPGHRGHRYAARSCRLLFPLALRHGLEDLWITVSPGNLASRRTAELAGAELVEVAELPEDSELFREGERRMCRYRIRLTG